MIAPSPPTRTVATCWWSAKATSSNTAPSRSGPVVDGLRVVREGLKAGERIVVNGLQRVRPGMVIKPRVVPMEGEGEPGLAAPPAAPGGSGIGLTA